MLNLLQVEKFNHQAEIETGVLGEECSCMLTEFSKKLRDRKYKYSKRIR